MEKVILIRFGEIFLKGKNRGFFEKTLLNNIKKAVSGLNAEVLKVPGRFLVQGYSECDECEVIDRLMKVAGIFSFSPALYFDTSIENISANALELMSDLNGTFKVFANRADKKFYLNSMELAKQVAEYKIKNSMPIYDAQREAQVIEKNLSFIESDEIKEGAIVTTTGLSDIFPSGILVGNVKVVTSDNYDLTKIVEVTPSVDFNDISVVTVLDRGVDAE